MIGMIKGSITSIKPPQVLLETHGVGYEIDMPISDCALLPTVGSNIIVHTHLIVREDSHTLYGFLDIEGRNYFRTLIKVSGIGPKIALALLSTLSLAELYSAVENNDIITLCLTPGVGKKMAERMLLELKGKLLIPITPNAINVNIEKRLISSNERSDILNALISLGYNEKEATNTVKQLPHECTLNVSTGIKEALKILNKHK